jgi:hypothetical protein
MQQLITGLLFVILAVPLAVVGPVDNRTDHSQQHCYHHVPTVNQRLLL